MELITVQEGKLWSADSDVAQSITTDLVSLIILGGD